MTNILAYIIAICSLYRKQLLIFAVMLLSAAIMLSAPDSLKQQKIQPSLAQKELYVPQARAEVGEQFTTQAELENAEKAAGYVAVGRFDSRWPAVVTEILTDNDSISFTRLNGTKHTYRNFTGYDMKMIRLAGPADSEVIIVFRSAEKH